MVHVTELPEPEGAAQPGGDFPLELLSGGRRPLRESETVLRAKRGEASGASVVLERSAGEAELAERAGAERRQRAKRAYPEERRGLISRASASEPAI